MHMEGLPRPQKIKTLWYFWKLLCGASAKHHPYGIRPCDAWPCYLDGSGPPHIFRLLLDCPKIWTMVLSRCLGAHCQNLHGDAIFQKSDPPEACTFFIPCLGGVQKLTEIINIEKDIPFFKNLTRRRLIWPPRNHTWMSKIKNMSKKAPEELVDTSRFQKMPNMLPEKIV